MSVPAYRPGSWTAVVSPGFLALLDPDVPAETVRAVWDRGADGVLGALALLARNGFEGLPGFALVAVRGQRVHVVQRGAVEVVVSSAVGSRTLTADGVTTWTEQVLEPAVGVELRVAGDAGDGPAWPLGDGAAPASSVLVSLVPAEAAEGTSAIPVVPEEPAVEVQSVEAQSVEAPAVESEAPSVEPAIGGPALTEPTPVVPHAVEEEPELTPDVDDEPADVEEPSEPYDGDIPGLVPLDADDASQEPEVQPEPQGPIEAPVFAAATERPVASSTAVDAPVADASSSRPSLVAVGGSSVDDHDGLTILSTDLAAIRERLPSWAADWGGDEAVPGPFAPPQASGTVPQLVLSTGLVVPLDRSVLLGRAPQVARVTNSELPHLVTVPSPQQDISRTHAEVHVQNGQVLVTDLASTNGVHVTRTGEGARRLHPGEPTVVESGHVVDLGDGVTFTVEPGS